MKKGKLIGVYSISALLLGLSLAACGSTPSNSAASVSESTASEDATSTSEDVTSTSEDATNSEEQSNSNVEVSESESVHEHVYGDWTLKTKPTMTEKGEAERVCAEDGEKEITEVPSLSDTAVWSVKDDVAPTCTADGSKTYTSVYGDVTVVVPATGHTYGDWEITVEPTAEAEGSAKKTCTEGDNEETVVVPALSDAGVWSVKDDVAPTCTADGSKTFTSVYGDVTVAVAATGHDFGDWQITTEPTVDAEGTAKKVCANCEEEETIVLPALSDTDTWTVETNDIGVATYTSEYGVVVVQPDKYTYRLNNGTENLYPGFYADHRSSYTFVDDGTGRYVSNNHGEGETSAFFDVFITGEGTVSFTYTVSSEKGYDKLTIYYNDASEDSYTAVVNGVSDVATDTLTFDVGAGDYFYFIYSKDTSGNKNDDEATISNFTFYSATMYTKSTLSYNSNGGTEYADVEVYNGARLTAPQAPVKEGYFFDGWFEDEDCTVPFKFEKGISENKTIYAKYTQGVTLTYNAKGGDEIASVLLRPAASVDAPEDPTKEGFYFAGWFTDEDCTVPFVFADGISENTEIFAGWRAPVVLTFNVAGGSDVASVSTDINLEIEVPTDPTREGYRFDGWFTDSTFATEFVFENGITENTEVVAKWVEQVTITIYNGEEIVTTETVDINSEYTPTIPSTFPGIISGYYTDADLTTEWIVGSEVTGSFNLYIAANNLLTQIAPAGVLSGIVNQAAPFCKTSNQAYEWTIVTEDSTTLTPTNKGIGNSESVIEFTVAKQSIVSFSYSGSSEKNYDLFIVGVKSADAIVYTQNVRVSDNTNYSGEFVYVLNAGDTIAFSFSKDGSGNKGEDSVTISNLKFTDGIPTSNITYVYNDGSTVDTQVEADYLSNYNSELLFTPTSTREGYIFLGWCSDQELTTIVTSENKINDEEITLYAKWAAPITVTFVVPEGVEAIAPVSAHSYTAIEVADPTLAGYIFRGWYADEEYNTLVDLSEGVTDSCELYAYFEHLPVGSNKENAAVAEFTDGSNIATISGSSSEEFQDYYVKVQITEANTYYFDFPTYTKEGGTVSSTGYSRYKVVNEEGTAVISSTGLGSSSHAALEEGTYYIVVDFGGGDSYSYTGWGTFSGRVYSFAHDEASEAIAYTFGETVTTEKLTLGNSSEKIVYSFTATQTGDYQLSVSPDVNQWTRVDVYDAPALSSTKAYITNSDSTKTAITNVALEAGTTYYIVAYTNTKAANGLAVTFKIDNYPQGYSYDNPNTYTMGTELTTDVTAGGAQQISTFTLDAAGAYKLSATGGSTSYTKDLYLYKVVDGERVQVANVQSSKVEEAYKYVTLDAGTYFLTAKFTSNVSYASGNYTYSLNAVAYGTSYEIAIDVTLPETGNVSGISNVTTGGTYYKFTTGADAKNFTLTASAADATVTIYESNGKTVVKTGTGSVQANLAGSTTYYLFVKGAADGEMTLACAIADVQRDGLTAATAFITEGGANAENLDMSTDKSYTVYYQWTATEDGTYAFYTLNNGNVDTKIYVYDDATASHQVAYNDDGKNTVTDLGGYKYDAYTTYSVTAGQTYTIKVTYTISSSYTATSLTLNIVAQ